MNGLILADASADNIDFMIHGLFSYNLFGHEVWITTSHVCILIVMLILIGFAIVANRKLKHAKEVPEGLQNVRVIKKHSYYKIYFAQTPVFFTGVFSYLQSLNYRQKNDIIFILP